METKKELTVKQQDFLDSLIACGGDARKAAEVAGYAPGSYTSVVKALKSEILDLAESVLAINAPNCLLYTSPSPRDGLLSRMPSSA